MIALVTVVAGRHDHLRLQLAGVRAGRVRPDLHVVVSMGDPAVASICGADATVVDVPTTPGRLPLAAARNAGVRHAIARGADVLVLLDVDCVPAPGTIARYADAAGGNHPDALLSGTVAYLPPPAPQGYRLAGLPAAARPHPGRPTPADDGHEPMSHELFWSLSFALTARTWQRIGGFCERYVGYGGEDTDFAETARHRGVAHVALGGAAAYHQWHASTVPPVQHVADIVRNARIFRERWGWWPMRGWLDAFGRDGLAVYDPIADDWDVAAGAGAS